MTYLKNIFIFIVVCITFSINLSKILYKKERGAATEKFKYGFFYASIFDVFVSYYISFIVPVSAMPVIYIKSFYLEHSEISAKRFPNYQLDISLLDGILPLLC